MTGALLAKKNYKTSDISIDAYNLGTGLKIVVAKIGQYVFVDKIIVH